jgi:hypothetical protein
VKIDFVIASGLYMIPSNLVLNVGTLIGYNNCIVIATADMKIGLNEQVNGTQVPSIVPQDSVTSDDMKKAVSVSPVYVSIGISLIVLLGFYVTSK